MRGVRVQRERLDDSATGGTREIGRRTSLGRCEFSVSYCGKSELGSVWSSSIIEESRFSFPFSSPPFLGETSIFKKLAILRLFRNCFASMKLNRK